MVRRGEIRPLILAVLTTRPMHGYEVITELEAKRNHPELGYYARESLRLLDDLRVEHDVKVLHGAAQAARAVDHLGSAVASSHLMASEMIAALSANGSDTLEAIESGFSANLVVHSTVGDVTVPITASAAPPGHRTVSPASTQTARRWKSGPIRASSGTHTPSRSNPRPPTSR